MYENGKYLKLLTLCTRSIFQYFIIHRALPNTWKQQIQFPSRYLPSFALLLPQTRTSDVTDYPHFSTWGIYWSLSWDSLPHSYSFLLIISWAATVTCLAPFCLPGDAIVPKAPCYRASLGPFAGIGKPGQGSKRLERNKPLVTSPEESLSRPRILDSSAMAAQSCGEPSDAIRQRQDDMNSQQTAGRDKDMNSQQTLKKTVSLLLPPFCSF